MEHSGQAGDGPIAIVGMACRLPGARDVDALWDVLIRNADTVTPIPPDRFDVSAHYAPTTATPGKTVSRHGGFLEDAFSFDAAFFGISPAEAQFMDPQQRILLQVVWEALEAAGIRPSRLAGTRGGVFVGQATAEYAEASRPPEGPSVRDATGSRIRAVTAGRVSYALDLRGPSVVLDAACSSSLVAVHCARQSLLTGESDLAIAGGVNIILSPEDSIAYSQGGMLSPGGRCRFGDAHADGFVRSEGVAAVVLKRLADARRDGDPVLALLLGSAVTNDGRGSGLLLQPSVSGQAEMLREACRSAGVDPGQLDYVEAHGTGTPVGDAVELQALAEAAGAGRSPDRPLRTGSVKTNIGHTEAAAGIVGLLKAVLIARHGVIPASLHLETPNPRLAEGRSPVEVVTANQPLDAPRALIGVSSFGLSGTNAHAVIGRHTADDDGAPGQDGRTAAGEPAARKPTGPDTPDGAPRPELLVLSARSATALRNLAAAYADHLGPGGRGREHPLHDICATAATRRDAHPYRLWAIGASHDELAAVLRALAAGEPHPGGGIADAGFGAPRRTVFVFPGQGSQWLGMGRDLLATSEAFRTAMAACDRAVRAELGWSVVELLQRDASAFPDRVEVVQPALWATQVALVAAWRELGVEPDVCVGHSMGEVAAACAAGALSVEDAAAVVCRRSRLMARVAGQGAMAAVELSAARAREAIGPRTGVCVAAENAPEATVLSGDRDELASICAELESGGVLCRPVRVNVASHSPHMDALHDALLRELAGISPRRAAVDMVSTVRRAPVDGPELDAGYWTENLRRPVRFTGTVRSVAEQAESVFLEISPHPLLTAAVEDTLGEAGLTGAAVFSLRRYHAESTELLRAAGRFFASGGRVDWERWYGAGTRPVPLPAYPWDRVTYRHAPAARRAPAHVRQIDLDDYGVSDWGTGLRFLGTTALPPVVALAALLETARQCAPGTMFALRDVELGAEQPHLDDAHDLALRVTLEGGPGEFAGTVEALRAGSPEGAPCVTAAVRSADGSEARQARPVLDRVLARCRRYLAGDDFHRLARSRGIEIGEAFRAVDHLWRRDGEVAARMRRPKAPDPAAWEAALLPLVAAWPAGTVYVPAGLGSVQLYGELTEEFWTVCRVTAGRGSRQAGADVIVLAGDGRVLAEFRGMRLRRVGPAGLPVPYGYRPAASRGARPRLGVPPVPPVSAVVRSGGRPLLSRVGAFLSRGAALPVPRPSGRPVTAAVAAGPASADGGELRPRAASAGTARPALDADALARRAAALLGMPATAIDLRRPLRDFGLDSLMAAQLRHQLRDQYGIDVSSGRLLGDESVARLTAGLTERSLA